MFGLSRVDDDTLEGELLDEEQDCQVAYQRFCTNTNVRLVEDPYEADVNNNPGQMIWACDACYDELRLDI